MKKQGTATRKTGTGNAKTPKGNRKRGFISAPSLGEIKMQREETVLVPVVIRCGLHEPTEYHARVRKPKKQDKSFTDAPNFRDFKLTAKEQQCLERLWQFQENSEKSTYVLGVPSSRRHD